MGEFIMNKVNKIKELVLNNLNGFSVDFVSLKPLLNDKDNYCIALTDNSKRDLVKSIKSVLSASLLFRQIKGSLVLGGWYDESSKRYCLDLVLMEKNKGMAMFMAKKFNQKALFNLRTMEEIENKDYME